MPNQSFSQMRLRNAEAILHTVRLNTEISRADLARATELSPATVSSIVDDLIGAGFLFETGARSSTMGRRPIGLVFNPESVYAAGIRLDGNSLLIVITDLNGKLKIEKSTPLSQEADACEVTETCIRLARASCKSAAISFQSIGAIGLAAPGPLKDDAPNIRGIHQPELYRTVRDALVRKLGIPIQLESMVNMAAFAEGLHGNGRNGNACLLYVRVGHAVRSAVLISGKLHSGKNNLGGELGHMVMPLQKWICFCGKSGCINGIASLPCFVELCNKSGIRITGESDLELHLDKPEFRELLAYCANAIAFGVAAAINLLAPDAVVVTSPYLRCGEAFQDPFTEHLSKYAQGDLLTQCKIIQSQLKGTNEALGAALWAIQSYPLLELVQDRLGSE